MNASNCSPEKAVTFVGEGLENHTFEDCLSLHLNPNSNDKGEIFLPDDKEKMRQHIRDTQAWTLGALKRS